MAVVRHDYFRTTRINSATTTQVKLGPAVLKSIVFGTIVAAGETIQIQDGNGTTNTPIVTITTTADLKPVWFDFQIRCTNGIRIITSGTSDLAVSWY